MKFTFNGIVFRIQFRHDRSRAWSDHVGHAVTLISRRFNGQNTKGTGLHCITCNLMIGNVPKALRERKTWCAIQYAVPDVEALLPDAAPPIWKTALYACGDPNRQAGDVFNKKDGREAALYNCLALDMPDFMFGISPEVIIAYNNRKGATQCTSK